MNNFLIIFACLVTLSFVLDCNATIGNYISPHSLGQQDELNDTLTILCPKIKISDYSYAGQQQNITLHNITLSCLFYDGNQVANIGENKSMEISGGKIQFMINFKFKAGADQGQGYASTINTAPNFTKYLDFGTQNQWFLLENSTGKVSLSNPFNIKRIEPNTMKNKVNLAINDLNQTSIASQLLTQINSQLQQTLNKTLREQKIFNDTLTYIYSHPSKSDLQIKYSNFQYRLALTNKSGFITQYLTVVQGKSIKDCTSDIPLEPYSFTQFGGIQTIHHIDFYRKTIQYILEQKWLDVQLGQEWNSLAFQFNAGDLYEIIPQVKNSIPPRTKLGGKCVSDGNIADFKKYSVEKFRLNLNYVCEIHTETEVKLAEFQINVLFVIKLDLLYQSLHVTIDNAVSESLVFKPIQGFIVNEANLAAFKINHVLNNLKGSTTFGTGFPTWPRDHPNLWISDNFTLLYDSSHIPHFEQLKIQDQ